MAKERNPLRVAVAQSGSSVTPVQRIVIEVLLHSLTRAAALKKLEEQGFELDAKVLNRWMRQENFVNALQARSDQLAARLTKSSVIVTAAKILEEALTEQPVFDKKGEIVGSKMELSVALNANEQIGKALGAFNRDESGRQVIVLDIDFSGRKNVINEYVDGELVEVPEDGLKPAERLETKEYTPEELAALAAEAEASELLVAAQRAESVKRIAALEAEIKKSSWLD